MRSGTLTRWLLIGVLTTTLGLGTAGVAFADTSCDECSNTQDGDNAGEVDSDGASGSGDAVGGQVTGIVSSGDASVDAKNRSEKADLESGEAAGANRSAAFVGLGQAQNGSDIEIAASDISGVGGDDVNAQEGDNDFTLTQAASASSGDAVGGQVIGVVTSAGGSADVVADNASKKVDVETGEASASNESSSFVGLAFGSDDVEIGPNAADISGFDVDNDLNVQEGDNSQAIDQTAEGSSGDGVAGQVLGLVSAGDASLDARNRSEKVDLETGFAAAANRTAALSGLAQTEEEDGDIEIDASDIDDLTIGDDANVQEGDNDQAVTQSATASSGDAVGGQVAGIVTSAGGSADVVADNASKKIDVSTGDASADNETDTFAGLALPDGGVQIGTTDIDGIFGTDELNVQEGDNDQDISQSADADSGDGVGGQVLGVVSAGDASLDARNRSEKVDLETGAAEAANELGAFAGLALNDGTSITVNISDITNIENDDEVNVQEGDNTQDVSQTAGASSGDGVGGQVAGIVTSAGGEADVVADNASKKVDVQTGESDAVNHADAFAGLANANDFVEVGSQDIDNVSNDEGNVQEGDNDQSVDQTVDASTGDGVAGQVLGAVSAGDTSLDARNRSEKIDLDTGDATADNEAAAFVGHAMTEDDISVDAEDVSNINLLERANVQDGDNTQNITQAADASSGDAVGGEVVGIVTAAGGSADVVADNASKKVDVETGEAEASNVADALSGLANAEGGVFVEDIETVNSGRPNIQEGDNDQSLDQTASASTGDGVGGQVLGVVSAGDTSLDARNRSEKVDLESGDASANNTAAAFAGLALTEDGDFQVVSADITNVAFEDGNVQEGDNEQELDQAAGASSGDAVGGQVAGIVTSAGGSADVVADNASKKVDVETGEADAANRADAVAGHAMTFGEIQVGTSDIDNVTTFNNVVNIQEGDNTQNISQTSDASSGDGVGGQVLGVVSAGDASLDARNRSEKVDLESGDASANNLTASFVGLAIVEGEGRNLEVDAADLTNLDLQDDANVQEGDNEQALDQAADASSGDAVGGQVAGIVTSAGGSADVVADNASKKVDVETGEADASNESDAFTGLGLAQQDVLVGASDISNVDGETLNVQEGDNTQAIDQSAAASSGDGVGGQVLGVVSSGDASLDARNRSEKIDLTTGDASAANASAAFTGLALSEFEDIIVTASDIDDVRSNNELNVQEGDNTDSISQTADASSGDAVGGQVAGIVTSAGGSADIVADNASKKIDVDTGDASASNQASSFVGLALSQLDVEVGTTDVTEIDASVANVQEGDNDHALTQTADASSGDGVGGQVLGVVSAGDTSLDVRNRSESNDLETGDVDAATTSSSFVGLAMAPDGNIDIVGGEDVQVDSIVGNVQEGDNGASQDQTAEATSGDAVAGQVTGAVTSAGGSVDAVLDNASKKTDATSGDVSFDDTQTLFVGLGFAAGSLFVGP